MEAVLSVQGLYKHYPGFALEDVSFSLAPKRIMGLIGKNGAGPRLYLHFWVALFLCQPIPIV